MWNGGRLWHEYGLCYIGTRTGGEQAGRAGLDRLSMGSRCSSFDSFFSSLLLDLSKLLLVQSPFRTKDCTRMFRQLLTDERMLIEIGFKFGVLREIVGIVCKRRIFSQFAFDRGMIVQKVIKALHFRSWNIAP